MSRQERIQRIIDSLQAVGNADPADLNFLEELKRTAYSYSQIRGAYAAGQRARPDSTSGACDLAKSDRLDHLLGRLIECYHDPIDDDEAAEFNREFFHVSIEELELAVAFAVRTRTQRPTVPQLRADLAALRIAASILVYAELSCVERAR